MIREAEAGMGAAGARAGRVDGVASHRLLKRNCLAAFDEIRTGLSSYLLAHPEAWGSRPTRARERAASAERSAEQRSRTPASSRSAHERWVTREATSRLLRLLFLILADGRGLRSRSLSLGVFKRDSLREVGPVDVPEVNRQEVLRLLGCSSVGGWDACWGGPFAGEDIRALGDAYEAILEHASADEAPTGRSVRARRAASEKTGRGGRPASGRKSAGRYYTPDRVTEYMVRKALGRKVSGLSSSEILDLKVLDPAMGSGHFLLEAAEYLARAYGRALAREAVRRNRPGGEDLTRYRNLVIKRCVYGVDTDPVGVEVARAALWLLAGGGPKTIQALRLHLRCGDALAGAAFDTGMSGPRIGIEKRPDEAPGCNAPNRLRPFHWKLEFKEAACRPERTGGSGFDVVLGNPPYLSFSGRQKAGGGAGPRGSGRMQAGRRGWPSAHGLFMLRAAELLDEGGILSFITPGQVGLLKGYGPVRAGLVSACGLLEVRYWGEEVFKGVTTPALTFVARRRVDGRGVRCVLKREDGSGDRFRPMGESPWFVSPYRHLLDRMARLHTTVQTFGDPGVHTGNVARRIMFAERRPGLVPVLEGRQVHAFACDPPARWLDSTYRAKAGEYFRISDPGVYDRTDIVIRQTAPRPVAARHSRRCHFRNSVLALKAPSGFSVEYLLGILNSDVADVLYQAVAPESRQRSFPQIKIHALRQLPIPDPRLGRNKAMAARIERAVATIETRLREGKPEAPIVRKLNVLVRRLYGLPAPPG